MFPNESLLQYFILLITFSVRIQDLVQLLAFQFFKQQNFETFPFSDKVGCSVNIVVLLLNVFLSFDKIDQFIMAWACLILVHSLSQNVVEVIEYNDPRSVAEVILFKFLKKLPFFTKFMFCPLVLG